MNFTELDAKLQGRNKERRKFENNTYLERRDKNIVMKYHDTDVATFYPDNSMTLDSGGWHTITTKERINWALAGTGFLLTQDKGIWYLHKRGTDGSWWDKQNRLCRYTDGIIIKADGTVEGGLTETPNRIKADKALKAKVKKFAELCASRLPLDQPSGGDCWYCSMVDDKGVTWGDQAKDNDHLDKHMKGGYVVPSMVANALKQYYNAPAAFWDAFKGTGVPDDSDRSFGKRAVTKAVYRYIMTRKGYAI